ncbi:MAG: ArsR/SmtB family transcription factor [Jatrophihabitans sp.]|uniref:ArsR/SmtB family transcription factor n=1 Tax=Jatrophihabitans sp. TaxID=1932789 RepID=UPI00391650C2
MTARRDATDEEARALASSLRLRILRACLHESRTNKEIAAILGRDPASVLHHVRTLVRTGFLVAEEQRRGTRGSREIPYRASRKSWAISTPSQDRAMIDTFLEEVALVPADQVDSARLGLQLSAEDMGEFRDRLRTLLDDFAARPDDPDGEAWSVFLSIHPDPNQR